VLLRLKDAEQTDECHLDCETTRNFEKIQF
jgi:hypothetical protein